MQNFRITNLELRITDLWVDISEGEYSRLLSTHKSVIRNSKFVILNHGKIQFSVFIDTGRCL